MNEECLEKMIGVERQLLKFNVLEAIKNRKDILFASFKNSAVTKSEKEAAWQEVLQTAQSVGLADGEHDWLHARDKLSGLWKGRTLAKRQNLNKSGSALGRAAKMDAVDNAILDIIGTNFPTIATATGKPAKKIKHQQQQQRQQNEPCDENETNRLKKELLQVEIYKQKLEILILERDLGLQHSEYTLNIVKQNNQDQFNDECNNESTIGVKEEQFLDMDAFDLDNRRVL